MNRENYDVVLLRMPAVPDATERLMDVFGIDSARAERLMGTLPRVVKEGVPREVAEQFQRAFLSMGARCQLKLHELPPLPQRMPKASNSPPEIARRLARETPSAPMTLRPDTRPVPRPAAVASLPASSSQRARRPSLLEPPPQRRWLGPAFVGAVLIAAGVLYWHMRSPRMGGLVVHRVGDEGRAKPALVLLHGFGAPGDDLVGLGEELAADLPDVQIIVPEGRMKFRGGRVWWKASYDEAVESREAVTALVDELIEQGTPPELIMLAGFSQGAILAMDVGLNHEHALGGVAMLSGTNEPRFEWASLLVGREDLPVFISHGRADGVLSFRTAATFVTNLKEHQYAVEFVPFDGGHRIPAPVRSALASFVAQRL